MAILGSESMPQPMTGETFNHQEASVPYERRRLLLRLAENLVEEISSKTMTRRERRLVFQFMEHLGCEN